MLSEILRKGHKSAMQVFAEKFKVAWQGEEHNELSKSMIALAATAVSICTYPLQPKVSFVCRRPTGTCCLD